MRASDLIHNGEIVLEGTVIPSGYEEYYDSGIITGSLMRGALAMVEGDVVVHVNSAGGDPTEGEAIRAMLAGHDGEVTVKVAGDAMSAASLMIKGADIIEMSEGSIFMIHDPSALTFGDEAAHTHTASVLAVLADTYAGVYARRSGLADTEVRDMMKAETFMGPEMAVRLGFADRITGQGDADDEADELLMVAAQSLPDDILRASQSRLQLAMVKLDEANIRATPKRPAPRAGAPESPIMGATQEAESMPNKTPKPAPGAPDTQMQPPASPAPAAPPAGDGVQDAVMAERERAKNIRNGAQPFVMNGRLSTDEVEAIIDSGVSPEAASHQMLTLMSEREPAPRATIQRDEGETQVEGMIEALGATMFGTEIKGPGASYRGLTMKGLAFSLSGLGERGHTEAERVKAGMIARGAVMAGAHQTTSDFGFITSSLMNRQLRDEYQANPSTYRRISSERTATDFRNLHSVQSGVDAMLQKVNEDGEYKATAVGDSGETYKVERYGRELRISFEAIVNDDLGAFQRLPRDFARGAMNLESRIAWSIIVANAVLSDGVALFAAGHKNLGTSGGVINVTRVGAARKAMWEQRPQGAKDDGDDFIAASPDLLFVPPALELAALQFVAQTTPDSDSNANPYKATLSPVVEPRLGAAAGGSETAWYLFDSTLPVLEHAFLQGYSAPMITAEDKINPRGMTLTAEHIFGAAAVEYRGAFKNNGA